MKASWLLLFKWTATLLLLESAPLAAGETTPRPEDSHSLSFSELDRAASDVIQRLKSINPNGKVMVIGGLALQKYLPGYRHTRDIDIYQYMDASLDIKEELLKDPRFYTRQTMSDNKDMTTKKELFYRNANGKNIQIDLPQRHVLRFEPASAKVLKDIPAGTVPYISVDELIISKIQSNRALFEAAKKAVDLADAKALLDKYPETTFTNSNHGQIVKEFLGKYKLPSQAKPNTSQNRQGAGNAGETDFEELSKHLSEGRIDIGFRSMGKDEKKLMDKTRSLVRSLDTAATHIGTGVYVANTPLARDGDSVVIVTADKVAFESMPKIWVPEEYWALPMNQYDIPGEREAQISRQQLEQYIQDQGLAPAHTLRVARTKGAAYDDMEQLVIPNDMIAYDQNGAPIQTSNGLNFRVQDVANAALKDVDYSAWKEIKGSAVYTKETLRERSASLIEKATEAASKAEKLQVSDSPTAAKEMADVVATAQRCAEGVGHLHRKRPDWVEFDDFNTAYGQYASARKAEAAFRKSTLIRAVEAQKAKVAQAVDKANGAADRASVVAEAEKSAEESKRLLQVSADEVLGMKTASESLDSIRQVLNGGDQEGYMRILVDNPRAVWAQLQKSVLNINGHQQASLDAAIIDEAAVAREEYIIYQEGVDEAKAISDQIEEKMKALSQTEASAEASGKTGMPEKGQTAEETKQQDEAEKARAKAVESAQKIASDPSSSPWLGTVLGGVASGIVAIGASAFLTSLSAGDLAAGLGADSSAIGGLEAANVPLMAAEQSISVTAAEVASVVGEVDPQMGLQMLLDSVPAPPTAPPVPADVPIAVALSYKRDTISSRSVSAEWAFQVAGPAMERAFEEACLLAINDAYLHMGI